MGSKFNHYCLHLSLANLVHWCFGVLMDAALALQENNSFILFLWLILLSCHISFIFSGWYQYYITYYSEYSLVDINIILCNILFRGRRRREGRGSKAIWAMPTYTDHFSKRGFPNPGSTLLKDDFLLCWKVQLKHCSGTISNTLSTTTCMSERGSRPRNRTWR